MNLPYDATIKEIEGLVKEFAEVEEVVIPRDRYLIAIINSLNIEMD